jgi:hypothetical protein
MAGIIKVRCNGPEKHINEVALDKELNTHVVLRLGGGESLESLPERLQLPCQYCTAGKVIITRAMIQDWQKQKTP